MKKCVCVSVSYKEMVPKLLLPSVFPLCLSWPHPVLFNWPYPAQQTYVWDLSTWIKAWVCIHTHTLTQEKTPTLGTKVPTAGGAESQPKRKGEVQRLIGTNRVQLLPGRGLRGADFIGMRVGGGCVGSSWEVEIGRSHVRRSAGSSVTVMDWT